MSILKIIGFLALIIIGAYLNELVRSKARNWNNYDYKKKRYKKWWEI